MSFRKLLKFNLTSIFFTLFLLGHAQAQTPAWRISPSIGFGGIGVTEQFAPNSSQAIAAGVSRVNRSEGPGTLGISLDRPLSRNSGLLIEHIRGFRIGPFSSGAHYTNVGYRYYFGEIPTTSIKSKSTQLIISEWIPFVGLSVGLATGKIERENDVITEVKGSGLAVGIRLGAEYLMRPGFGIRPEIVSATTISSSAVEPSQVAVFSLGLGFFFWL